MGGTPLEVSSIFSAFISTMTLFYVNVEVKMYAAGCKTSWSQDCFCITWAKWWTFSVRPKNGGIKNGNFASYLSYRFWWFWFLNFEQTQRLVLERERKKVRDQIVDSVIANSSEKTAQSFVEDFLVQSLFPALNELQNQAQLLQASIEQSSPLLHQVFPLHLGGASLANKSHELLVKNREVSCDSYDNLIFPECIDQ